MKHIECIVRGDNQLGEAPLWCDREQALYWVDIRAPAIYRYASRTGQVNRYEMSQLIGSFAFRESGGMLLALQSGFHTFDPSTRRVEKVVDPEANLPDNRFNEGKCDRAGRFWAGTMSNVDREPTGSLYRLDANFVCTRMMAGIIVPNSMAWSPDDRIMYFADTWKKSIIAYDFDLAAGVIGRGRVFVDGHDNPGKIDGSTVDADGCLWNAESGSSRVVRYTPEGKVDRIVEFPVTQPTSCAFGGRTLDTLFVTTATQRLSPEELKEQPLAGALFAVNVGVKGLPEPRFLG